jgi:hypothetical protein
LKFNLISNPSQEPTPEHSANKPAGKNKAYGYFVAIEDDKKLTHEDDLCNYGSKTKQNYGE